MGEVTEKPTLKVVSGERGIKEVERVQRTKIGPEVDEKEEEEEIGRRIDG